MKNKKYFLPYFIFGIIIVSGIIFGFSCNAQSLPNEFAASELTGPNGFINRTLNLIISLSGALALLASLMAAFKFITSAGEVKKIEQGKSALKAAIFGIVAVMISNSLFVFIGNKIGKQSTIEGFLGVIISFLRIIIAPLAIIMFLYGSYLIMKSGGSEKDVKTAKAIFVYTTIGIALSATAYSIPAMIAFLLR